MTTPGWAKPHAKKTRVPRTTVVHVKHGSFNPGDPTHIYIGRAMPGFQASIWANPFRVNKKGTLSRDRGQGYDKKTRGKAESVIAVIHDGSREEVIQKYSDWVKSQPELMARLPELKGKRLGCWCHPKPCHGDVLADMANNLEG